MIEFQQNDLQDVDVVISFDSPLAGPLHLWVLSRSGISDHGCIVSFF